MKVLEVGSVREARDLEARVLRSAARASDELREILGTEAGMPAFRRMKFEPIGYDPLDEERRLNLIEQVNQSITYLVSLRAVEFLLQAHPSAGPYRLNLGTAAGLDVESGDGSVVAEVFAAVTPDNNQKLQRDVERVAESRASHRYVFYASQRPGREVHAPGVSVHRIPLEDLFEVDG